MNDLKVKAGLWRNHLGAELVVSFGQLVGIAGNVEWQTLRGGDIFTALDVNAWPTPAHYIVTAASLESAGYEFVGDPDANR
ncbi:MAG: hypothetical protein FWD63_05650 [Propionibacteriaceae bacterium]|nr:hypothetical protein [Propionibacteriaceae bacterium]